MGYAQVDCFYERFLGLGIALIWGEGSAGVFGKGSKRIKKSIDQLRVFMYVR